ncbi:MAG: SLC13 family permease [Phycisphaerales bacterium JB043]
MDAPARSSSTELIQWIGLAGGVIASFAAYWATGLVESELMTPSARVVASVGVVMALWWMTEAIPLAATSLLPVILFPLLGVMTLKETTAPYANPLLFLFGGGFLLALAMERWGLHRRIALRTVMVVGTSPRAMVGGCMVATGIMSMWVSNTATAVMMLPIATSLIALRQSEGEASDRFAICLLIGIGYAASIGGLGTIIGTPPNAFLVSYLKESMDIDVSFARWMIVGVPIVALYLAIGWFVLTRWIEPVGSERSGLGRQMLRERLRSLGPTTRPEWMVMVVFACTVLGWLFRGVIERLLWGEASTGFLSDAGIVMIAALALFALPSGDGRRVMDWETAERLPWGVLILFGGGMSLGAGIQASGLDLWLGSVVEGMGGVPVWVVMAVAVAIVILLSEVASNTAAAITLVPVMGAMATSFGIEPVVMVTMTALAASVGYMMPVATPPNAIVFSSGLIPIRRMMRAGIVFNIVGGILVVMASLWLVPRVLG